MSIQSIVDELYAVENEIKRLNALAKPFRQRKAELHTKISEYLKAKDQPGLKHKDKAIIIEQKEVYSKKPKQEKESDIKKLLENYNIRDSEKFFQELDMAKKGEFQEIKDKIVVKKIKTKKEKKKD